MNLFRFIILVHPVNPCYFLKIMTCPVCKYEKLESKRIEEELWAEVCPKCEGNWIPFRNYEAWYQTLDKISPAKSAEQNEITIPQFQLARLCPKCKRILVKYDVGNNAGFKIDRCSDCAGVWLDKDEWENLKNLNLHDEMQKIFTDHWQKDVDKEERRQNLEKIYKEKFGAESYLKIKEFKTWLDENDKAAEILAYLDDENPLQI